MGPAIKGFWYTAKDFCGHRLMVNPGVRVSLRVEPMPLQIPVPALLTNPDLFGAFAAGFVNPYASGYTADVFFCWVALAAGNSTITRFF
jgi:hypothetical protein